MQAEKFLYCALFFRTFLSQLSSGHLEKGKSNHSFYANVLRKESMKMKTRKTIRKIVSLVLAVMMMASAFAFTASAAETNNSSSSLTSIFLDSLSKSVRTATAEPTPEHPLQYSYKAQFSATDPYGRLATPHYGYGYSVDFYPSKEAYENGAEPIGEAGTWDTGYGEGLYKATYSAVFNQTPPRTLYWVVEPETNVIFSPNAGYASAQLDA